MNAEQLSMRLEKVASFIPNGARVADIGSDHAYLPCYLAKQGRITSAIAGEVVEGPYKSAKRQVEATGLQDMIEVRLGDGLEVLEPGEADCITIAGMGGVLISEILEAGKNKLDGVNRLILQPNVGANSVREWLYRNGWELIDEEILEEDGKIYEILVAETGDPLAPYHDELELGLIFGPFLLKRKEAAFLKKWSLEKENWRRVLSQLDNAQPSREVDWKKQELAGKIRKVEEVLAK
ncbi:tRNA (adenine(22)-N(1))-methyltransferase TrmK [Neobacillus piezotolerans]|uniref:tRNA (Adenine(22)-N(1))-methyltransferase TrmK n=1 Tax=Neobacillus piezotolerans TaxID=2259171 RepID=A0A3D8GLV2_9BACI|nr:tRNA (adenine(22)-N(1))-methyltransferase TrmK [Neobacillus piezotolerans]RDU35403.1 tRNA (adenine(22)-N(1))-methyltransferase TrmK [Neobacillus piezotolerans]